MIDFFMKEAISDNVASLLVQHVFNLKEKDVLVCSLKYLESNRIEKLYQCLVIKIPMKGDVCTLLQTYRVEIPFTVFLERLQSFCRKESVTCYVPSNNFDDFYLITPNNEMVEVTQVFEEGADNCDEAYFVKKQ